LDQEVQADFGLVMQRMRRLRARLSHHDSAERVNSFGADVYLGTAKFVDPSHVEVEGQKLEFRRCVIATGTRPSVPPLPGLDQVRYLTNETIFSLTELPPRLIILGSGVIACEMAQAFRRFGSEVHMIFRSEKLLRKEEPQASQRLRQQLVLEGVILHPQSTIQKIEKAGNFISIEINNKVGQVKLIADTILLALGRTPNVDDLELEAAGIKSGPAGVEVNDYLQTTNPRVYAAGDVCSKFQFAHAADAMARICIQNALFFGHKKVSELIIPRCTYTDPEIAHVGLTPEEADARGIAIDSYRVELAEVDRAVLDGEDQGFAVVHTRNGRGEIVGATIMGSHAGEMIGEITLLMTHKMSLAKLASTIHCYPTQVEVLKRIADNYMLGRLTPVMSKILRRLLQWRR